jgi:ankyrin repeat protein
MRTARVLLVLAWGAILLAPTFSESVRLRILAATGTMDEIRAALKNSGEITKRDSNGVSALMLAAARNHDPAVISLLISAGADINARTVTGETALIYAAEYNPNPDAVQALLKAGASLEDRDGLGRTPLMAAAWGNSNPAVVAALLKAGANAKEKSYDGKTALDYAENNSAFPTDGDACRALQDAMK